METPNPTHYDAATAMAKAAVYIQWIRDMLADTELTEPK